MTGGEFNQLMLERMQQLEEALDRAEAGVATPGDWDVIRYECGIPRRQNSTTKSDSTRSEEWVW